MTFYEGYLQQPPLKKCGNDIVGYKQMQTIGHCWRYVFYSFYRQLLWRCVVILSNWVETSTTDRPTDANAASMQQMSPILVTWLGLKRLGISNIYMCCILQQLSSPINDPQTDHLRSSVWVTKFRMRMVVQMQIFDRKKKGCTSSTLYQLTFGNELLLFILRDFKTVPIMDSSPIALVHHK